MTNTQRVAVWLMPAAADAARLRPALDELARRYDAPRFEPHVTVLVGEYAASMPADVLLDRIGRDVAPFELAIRTIRHSDLFTKTLYLELEPHPSLERLEARARAAAVHQSDYVLAPHLSLLYAAISAEERSAAAAAVHIDGAAIRFDAIEAIGTGERTESPHDVEAWAVLARRPLGR